jgi:hypothetical protein
LTSGGQFKIESLVEGAALRIFTGTANNPGIDGFAELGLDGYVSTENANAVVGTTRIGGTVATGRIITSDVSAVAADAQGLRYATATLT